MTFVGCDLHTRQQHVAVLDTRTGEVQERRLAHDDQTVEHFYASLPRPVTVGVESTGYAQWFHALMQRQGHTLLVGDAARIRAMVVRKTKTDRRDAAHLLRLLSEDRFPVIWVPDPRVRDLRALVTHRMRLVRMRTMVKNGLHAIALNHRLAAGNALWILGAPHKGLVAAIVLMRAAVSALIGGRPGRGRPESLVQCSGKRRRCHRRTVSGDTMTRACLQPAQTLASPTHKRRSIVRNLGRGTVRLYTASCWRRARFSRGELALAGAEEREESKQVEHPGGWVVGVRQREALQHPELGFDHVQPFTQSLIA
jgi:hypothetical protein